MLKPNGIWASEDLNDDQGGLETVNRHLAMDYATDGIRVNAVAPVTVEYATSSSHYQGNDRTSLADGWDIASRVNKTPAQVLLAWAIQRGTALLTTSKTPSRINENFDVSAIPEEAVQEIAEGISSRFRFNAVVETGVPGFIPRGK